MKPKVYLIDIDKTLTNEVCYCIDDVLNATPREDVVKLVNRLYEKDWVIVYTARIDELIPATLKWLRKNNISFHAFSNNKIPGDYYVDDRAINVEDFIKGVNNE